MATGFYILISPNREEQAEPVPVYLRLLRAVLESGSISGGTHLVSYQHKRPFDYGSKDDPYVLVDDGVGQQRTVEEVFSIIEGITIPDVYFGVSCHCEAFRWDNDICDCKPSEVAMLVEYESPNFGSGHEFRKHGSYRIWFDSRSHFNIRAVDLSKCPADSPMAVSKILRFGTNLKLVDELFKKISNDLMPLDACLVTDSERVNPANFHMVFHSTPSGFLFDVRKMLQLHNVGGGYFYNEYPNDFDPSYRSLRGKGIPYLTFNRPEDEAKRLFEQLDFYSHLLAGTDLSALELNDDEILEIITSCEDIEIGGNERAIFAAHPYLLFGHLDCLYLKLLDAAATRLIAKRVV